MSTVIDEQGRLFGRVNVIDALFVFFVVMIVVAGVAFVSPPGPTAPTVERSYSFTAEVSPTVADAVMRHEPTAPAVTDLRDVELVDSRTVYAETEPVYGDEGEVVTVVRSRPTTIHTIAFTATMRVTLTDDGLPTYRGDRLLIGEHYDIDLGYTVVNATLTGGDVTEGDR